MPCDWGWERGYTGREVNKFCRAGEGSFLLFSFFLFFLFFFFVRLERVWGRTRPLPPSPPPFFFFFFFFFLATFTPVLPWNPAPVTHSLWSMTFSVCFAMHARLGIPRRRRIHFFF
jgi:hypothetical protein